MMKKAYQIYLRFEVFGGSLNCKLFTEIFPHLKPDDSFEYEVMEEAYRPEEFATTYLRPELLESEMNDTFKYQDYLKRGGGYYD